MSIVVNKTRLPVTQWQTESGSVVSISDARKRYAKSLSVALEPIQSGSGVPSPDNVRPISGHESVKVTRTGKNLLDQANATVYKRYFQNTTPQMWATSGDSASFAIPCTAGVTYTVTMTSMSGNIFRVGCIKEEIPSVSTQKVQIYDFSRRSSAGSITITPSSGAKYIVIQLPQNEARTAPLMVELGSATAYEPYQGISVTLSLGQTVYGGSVDVTNGVLTMTKAKILLRNLGYWSKSSSYPGGFYSAWTNIGADYGVLFANKTPFISSHAKTAEVIGDYVLGTCFSDNSCNFRLMNASDTVSDWTNYLETQYTNGTPVEVCGTLANPQTIQLSPNQIEMLMRNNTVWSDAGVVTLNYARIHQ